MAKLLIVEDDRILNDAYLIKFGEKYDLKMCPDGESAVKAAKSWSPDLILLDLYLQNIMNGVEVLREIREEPKTKNIPVLVITNLPDMEDKVMELGAYRCLMKSDVDLNKIEKLLEEMLEKTER